MTTVYDATAIDGTSDGDSDGGVTYRHICAASTLSAATGDQVQVVFRTGSSGGTLGSPFITGAFIGRRSGATLNFTGNQVRLKFAGSNSVNATAANQNITSDISTLGEAFDNTKDYIVSFRIDSVQPSNYDLTNGAKTGADAEFLGGSSAGEEALTTASGGYAAQANTGQCLRQIFITASAAGGGLALAKHSFKIDKFKTPTRAMGPNAGLMQVKAFPQPAATTVQQQIVEILQVRQRSSYW